MPKARKSAGCQLSVRHRRSDRTKATHLVRRTRADVGERTALNSLCMQTSSWRLQTPTRPRPPTNRNRAGAHVRHCDQRHRSHVWPKRLGPVTPSRYGALPSDRLIGGAYRDLAGPQDGSRERSGRGDCWFGDRGVAGVGSGSAGRGVAGRASWRDDGVRSGRRRRGARRAPPESGRPLAAWVVVGLPTADTPEVLFEAVPSTWTVTRAGAAVSCRCRCCPGRRVTTLAARCPHYEPGADRLGLAAREPRSG